MTGHPHGEAARFDAAAVSAILRSEQPSFARKVTVKADVAVPAAIEWWLRRAGGAAPIALVFSDPHGEMALPADAFGGTICALVIKQAPSDNSFLIDIENQKALRGLRIFAMYCNGNHYRHYRNLRRLTMLPSLALLCIHWTRNRDQSFRWLAECRALRYVLLSCLFDLTSVAHIALALSLRSLALYECAITDIAPLAAAVATLECLILERCGRVAKSGERGGATRNEDGVRQVRRVHVVTHPCINGYEALAGMNALRVLTLELNPFVSWTLMRNCRDLERLRVASCSDAIQPVEILATAAPYLCSLELRGCNEIERIGDSTRLDFLTVLSLDDCAGLRTIDLTGLDSLEELTVQRCRALHSLHGFTRTVKRVAVRDCGELASLDLAGCSQLKTLVVHVTSRRCTFGLPEELLSLTSLTLTGCSVRRCLDLRTCELMATLHLQRCGDLEALLLPEGRWTILTHLDVDYCHALGELNLRGCTALRAREPDKSSLLGALQPLVHPTMLRVRHCPRVVELDLRGCQALRELNVFVCHRLHTVQLGDGLASLTSIDVRVCPALQAVNLSGCTALRNLCAMGCSALRLVGLRRRTTESHGRQR